MWAYNGRVPGPELRIRLGETLRVALHEQAAASRRRSTGTASACRTRWTAFPTSPSRPSSRAGPSSTNSRPRTRAPSGSILTSVPASRSSAASTACSSSRTPHRRPYARDVVWVLDDWLLDETRQIFGQFNTPHDLDARRALGQLRHRQRPHRHRLDARGGERIRLRLLNTSNGRMYAPDFGALDPRDHRRRRALPARARSRSAVSSWLPAIALDLDVTLPTAPQSRVAAGRRSVLSGPAQPPRRRRSSTGSSRSRRHRSRRRRTRACPRGRRASQFPVTKEFRARRAPGRRLRDRVDDQRRGVRRPRPPRQAGADAGARRLGEATFRQRQLPAAPDSPARDVLQAARPQRRARSTSRSFATPCSCTPRRRSTSAWCRSTRATG